MSAGTRNARIDLMRGVAILLVLFHHFDIPYRLADTTLSHLLGWTAVHAVARNGNYGVTIFFAISGFLITSNAQRRWGLANIRAPAFYALRAARILPCLVLLLVLVNLLALGGITVFQNHPETGGPVPVWLVDLAALTFWMNVLMVHAGWLNYVLCVLWSLSVEEVFYLCFPLLCLLFRRDRRLVLVWSGFIVAGPLWRLTHQDTEAGFLYAYLANFDCIAIGCCASVLSQHVRLRSSWASPLQAVIVAGMAVLYLIRSIAETNVYGVTAMALGTAALLVVADRRPALPVGRNRALAALTACGRLSYELYLFHLIVLGALQVVWPPPTVRGDEKLVLLLAYLLLSITSSALIARWYAEPLNRLLRNRLGPHGSATPA